MKGILLSKIPQSDYNFLGNLLISNGKTLFLQFPASRGSGKKKSLNLEVGNCLEVEISKKKTIGVENSYYVKEWHTIWHHRGIRTSYSHFIMLCIFLEVINYLALPIYGDSENYSQSQDEGLFILLSNAIFYLDQDAINTEMSKTESSKTETSKTETSNKLNHHLGVFLTKLIREMGIHPNAKNCILCDAEINYTLPICFRSDLGGIQCYNCGLGAGVEAKGELDLHRDLKILKPSQGMELNLLLNRIHGVKYKSLFGSASTGNNFGIKSKIIYGEIAGREVLDVLFNYFCYQLQLNKMSFKTLVKYLQRSID